MLLSKRYNSHKFVQKPITSISIACSLHKHLCMHCSILLVLYSALSRGYNPPSLCQVCPVASCLLFRCEPSPQKRFVRANNTNPRLFFQSCLRLFEHLPLALQVLFDKVHAITLTDRKGTVLMLINTSRCDAVYAHPT